MGVMSVSTLRQGQYDLVMFFYIDSRILKLKEWKKTVIRLPILLYDRPFQSFELKFVQSSHDLKDYV